MVEKTVSSCLYDKLDNWSNRLAVIDSTYSLTYKQLYERINFLANVLKKRGVTSSDRVVVYLSQSNDVVISMFAIWLIGATYVPVNITYPIERLRYIIRDTNSKAIITTKDIWRNIGDIKIGATIFCDQLKYDRCSRLQVFPRKLEDEAVIIYTSGTSGHPKGVVLTHNACLHCGNWREVVNDPLNQNARVISTFNFASIPAIATYCLVLTHGASLYLISNQLRNHLNDLYRFILDEKITDCHLPTSLAIALVSQYPIKNVYMPTGGEKMRPFIPKQPGCKLINLYGSTECMIVGGCLFNGRDKYIPTCKTLFGEVLLVDEKLHPVKCGEIGELLYYSKYIDSHYLNLPDENKKKYILINKKKYYRSGDLARFNKDGILYVTGRINDGMVKINGNRIELSEIDNTIIRVNQKMLKKDRFTTAVCVLKHIEGQDYLCCYYEGKRLIDESRLVELLRKELAEYMIPSIFVHLNKLPVNVNNKIMVSALPNPDLPMSRIPYSKPTNQYESDLCHAFEETLHIRRVGINDDFIALGGNSFNAIYMLNKLNQYYFTVADIIKFKTPKNIAKCILLRKQRQMHLVPKYTLKSGCPLNESQLNIYLDITINQKNSSYILPFELGLSNRYQVKEAYNAIQSTCKAHPILNSRIALINNHPYLKLNKVTDIEIKHSISKAELKKFFTKPFNLEKSLSRFLILVDSHKKVTIYAAIQHLIFDGVSYSVLNQSIYDALNKKNLLGESSFLYSSAYDEKIKSMPVFKKAEQFFVDELSDQTLFSSFIPDVKTDIGGTHSIKLDINEKQLSDFLKKYSITKNIFFTSAFAYTLSRFTSSNYANFCIIDNGRDHLLLADSSIGMFSRTLPLLINCESASVDNFITLNAHKILDTINFNFYPFRFLKHKFNVNSNILFQYHPKQVLLDKKLSSDVGRLIANYINHSGDASIADLDFYLKELKDSYLFKVNYNNKYSSNTIHRFLKVFQKIVNGLLNKKNLADIDYSLEEDMKKITMINNTNKPLIYKNIIDAFNHSLIKMPKRKYLSYKEQSFTYQETASLVNQINKLIGSIPHSSKIAVLVHRSHFYVLSALAILVHHSIYVPIDDHFPDERIKFILKDASTSLVLVTDETYLRAKTLIKQLNRHIKIINISNIKPLKTLSNPLSSRINLDDVACLLYTSGTTGVAKGNLITHRAILNLNEWYVDYHRMNKDDVYAMYTVPTFDMHTIAFYSPMLVGASVDIVPEEVRLDLNKLNMHFKKVGATHTFLPTQIGKLFINKKFKTPIKIMEVAGEKLGEFNVPTKFKVYDAYGPTESIVVSSVLVNQKIDSSSVGSFNQNIRGYILDQEKRMVPFGAVGELYLSGYQLAKGYLNRPKENQKAFSTNPFTPRDSNFNRLYKTGDLVRYLPDYTIGIIGRSDSQIKVRGNRVELGEVENEVKSCSIVKNAFVTAVTSSSSNKELVAYVVLKHTCKNVSDIIKSHVNKYKPSYMVPTYVEVVKRIPLNNNGKVDIRALPNPKITSKNKFVPSENITEQIIVEAFEEVLNIREISVYDNFVNLGGDSIQAVRLLSILDDKKVYLKIADILQAHPIRELAEIANQKAKGKMPDIFTYPSKVKTPHLFFVHSMNSGSEIYYRLAQHLSPYCSFSAFEQYNINHYPSKLNTIEKLAKKYVELMKKEQPHGPYLLGGWSYGGTVAFAMAKLLRERKEEVSHLILLDTNLILDKKIQDFILDSTNHNTKNYVLRDPLFAQTRLRHNINILVKNTITMTPAWLNYVPHGVYDRPVLFVKATGYNPSQSKAQHTIHDYMLNFEAGGYEKYIKSNRLKIVETPFAHDNILDENAIDIIVNAIKQFIKRR